MYVATPLTNSTVPLTGSVLLITVKVSPSGSVSFVSTIISTGVSSGVVSLSSTATGDAFSTMTVMFASVQLVVSNVSQIVYVAT